MKLLETRFGFGAPRLQGGTADTAKFVCRMVFCAAGCTNGSIRLCFALLGEARAAADTKLTVSLVWHSAFRTAPFFPHGFFGKRRAALGAEFRLG